MKFSFPQYVLHATSRFSLFDYPNHSDVRWKEQIIKLLVMQSSPLLCYLILLRPKHLPQHPFLQHYVCSTLNVRGKISDP